MGMRISSGYDLPSALNLPIMENGKRSFNLPGRDESFFEGTGSRSIQADA
jgi:hypothetical protein